MLSVIQSDTLTELIGVGFAALLGVIGWFIRRWIKGLETLVNQRGDNIEGQVDGVASHVVILDNKVDAVRESVAEVRGALGMPVTPVPLPEPVAIRGRHPWGLPR